MHREIPKMKVHVSYVYADGPEQQRALEILTEMLRDSAARYRRQQAESISHSTPSDPVLDPELAPQAPDKYPTSTHQTSDNLKLLKFCITPRAMRELLSHMGLKDRETFMTNYLHPLIRAKLLAMTDPDSRRSPKQKYVATSDGLEAIIRA